MSSRTKMIIDHIIIAILGGLIYYGIEIIWRGYSDISMVIVAGIIYVKSGMLDEGKRKYPFWVQVILGTCIATFIELIAGLILNRWLGLGIWDYSDVPGNFMGQICPQFTLAWAALMCIAIPLENAMHKMLDRIYRLIGKIFNK